MISYYPKRAFELLINEGIVGLWKSSVLFVKQQLQYLKYCNVPNFERIYTVPVSAVNYIIWGNDIKKFFDGKRPAERIWSGEWYKLKNRFEETYIHRSFMQRFKEGYAWEDTPYYEKLKNDPDLWERRKKRFKSTHSITDFLNEYEKIYESMVKNGYDETKYISVYIGPQGEYIRKNGAHKLSMAKIISSIDAVPVKVYAIHERWQQLRDNIYNNGFSSQHNEFQNHPDLQNIFEQT